MRPECISHGRRIDLCTACPAPAGARSLFVANHELPSSKKAGGVNLCLSPWRRLRWHRFGTLEGMGRMSGNEPVWSRRGWRVKGSSVYLQREVPFAPASGGDPPDVRSAAVLSVIAAIPNLHLKDLPLQMVPETPRLHRYPTAAMDSGHQLPFSRVCFCICARKSER